eukprot:716199_1
MLAVVSMYKTQQENAMKQRDYLLEKLEAKYSEYIQSLLKQKLLISININKRCDEIIRNTNNCIYNCIHNTINTNINQLSNNISTSNSSNNTNIKLESNTTYTNISSQQKYNHNITSKVSMSDNKNVNLS